MARAVLRIEVDTSAVARAMGDLRGVARSAQAAMTSEVRREAAQRDRIARDETRHRQRLELEALRATRDAQKQQSDVTRAAMRDRSREADRASREEIARQNNTTRLYIQAERIRSQQHAAEERERTRATNREATRRAAQETRVARDIARVRQQAARETRAYEDNIERRRGRTVGRVVNAGGQVVNAGMQFAQGIHGQIQSARMSRAVANRGLTSALRGAGLGSFAPQARQRIADFASQTGMSYEDVATALRTGQEQGSVLDLNGRTERVALDEALSTVRQANAMGTDPGKLLAARGRLRGAGITGPALDETLRYVQFAADRGSVEVDQIIQQGLPGAIRLMSQRSANASPEERQRTAVAAFRESVAAQEVMAGAGGRAGQVSNAYAAFQTALGTPRRQDLMRANLSNYARSLTGTDPATQARRAAISALVTGPNALYEDDPTRRGARRLRSDVANAPLSVIERVTEAMGGDSNAAAQIFAGGGHGNAQALLSNVRTLFTTLGAVNPETGRTRLESVRDISRGGYTQGDVDTAAHDIEGDDLSALTRAQEAGIKALTDNSSEIVKMSRSFADWTAAHPFETEGGRSTMGLTRDVASTGFGAFVGSALPRAGSLLRTLTALSSGGGLVGGAVNVLGGALAGVVGLGVGSAANQAIYSDRGTSRTNAGPAYTNALGGDFWRGLGTSIVQAFETAGAQGKIRVALDAHTAAHAASQNATPGAQ